MSYTLTLKDGDKKVYSVHACRIDATIERMKHFITKKYGITGEQ